MRRAVATGTLVLSCLVGASGGVVLHARWPDPFSRSTPAASPAAAPRTPPEGPSSTATPKPRASSPSSPSPSTPGPGAPPAFTRLALLQPPELVSAGWQVARRVDAYAGVPATAITPCTTVSPDVDGLVSGFAATYASDRTTAAEVVARFGSVARAESEFAALRVAVAGCVDAPTPYERRRVTGLHEPSDSSVSEIRWWNTRSLDDARDRGVVGIVRVDDRVAVLSLDSAVSDPAVTTRVDGLLSLAGRRLV